MYCCPINQRPDGTMTHGQPYDRSVELLCKLCATTIYVFLHGNKIDRQNNYCWILKIVLNFTYNCVIYQSLYARHGIFWLIWLIPCLSMPWLLRSLGHQQAWYWQYRIGNMWHCSIVSLVFFCWTKPKVWYDNMIHNIIHTLAENKIVDHSVVVRALPVGTAPTTHLFST